MGFFGAPISVDNPEFRACKVAIEQQKRLVLLNQKWLAQGYPPVKIRIGISTGEVMVGNIGSNEHFNYTVLGDTVNLASRLE
jgi:adenylate cyclase